MNFLSSTIENSAFILCRLGPCLTQGKLIFFSVISKATELSSIKKTKFAKWIILNFQLQRIVELLLERVKQT
jgi:hypothetical protein